MTTLWCELAWLGGTEPDAEVLIEIDGGLIERVTPDAGMPPPGAERVRGLTIPGLANAHSHAFQRALRGRTHRATGSFWTWREQMYALAERLDPELTFALARATFAEMALAGITLVGEFDYVHYSDAIIAAAREAGIRLTLLDACYLEGGLERFHDPSVSAWVARVSALGAGDHVRIGAGDHVRIGAAIHSIRAVDPDSARVVAALAAENGWPLHAHVSEQIGENEECQKRYGDSPTAVLHRAGALDALFTAVHATHLLEHDIALLRSSGAFCCMCPTTERDLADGIGPAPTRLALGSDSNAIIEPFEEARAVELDERLVTGVRVHHAPFDLLAAATVNGYASLGWAEGGTITPGALADLTVVGLDTVRLAGAPREQLLDALVFAGAAADVTDVLVAGEFVVRDGRHLSIDVPGELARACSL
jgi:formiminoglutamate deiminase